ncbi:hypothetical protein DICVIV_10024 [Dictyocaulus viviparus]|uniref:Uncharacterized protein n=1 Tax=Dictyocaulus viviparus TaxID=29172 RepID=A0A0D8XH75_DICVI|nr:hypothetical protein DICVIV_10024 [Dictyocaulus viviparus]
MKTAVFGHDSGGDGPTASCCGAPSLTFTPPASLALAPNHQRRTGGGTLSATGAGTARPHSRRTSRMQNVGCKSDMIRIVGKNNVRINYFVFGLGVKNYKIDFSQSNEKN